MPLQDVTEAIIAILLDEAVAGDAVYPDELPDDAAGGVDDQGPTAVVVAATGGSGFASQSWLDTQRVDIHCYAPTLSEARQLALEAHEVLNRTLRRVARGTLVHSITSAGGFVSGRDYDTRWPYVMRAYQVLYDTRRAGGESGSGS